MIPYLQERFASPRWEMDLFSLPKRIRNKGREEVTFETFDWTIYQDSLVVQKYIQTYRDYLWWTKLRIQKSYDLIHAHHPIAGLAMKSVFPEVPLIQTIHSSYERAYPEWKNRAGWGGASILQAIYGELEHCAERLLTVSDSFRRYLSPYVKHPDRIGIIPNGFDEKRFKPIPHDNAVPQLVTVCRLVPAKGLDILFKACAELKDRGHDYVLHIIGDGPIRPDLEELAQRLGIYNETIFMDIRCILKNLCRSLMCLYCHRVQKPLVQCSLKPH